MTRLAVAFRSSLFLLLILFSLSTRASDEPVSAERGAWSFVSMPDFLNVDPAA